MIIKTGICRGSIGISEKGKGPFSDIATITAAGDILAPMPPSDLTAFSVTEGICLTWKNPTTNADGSPLTDLAWIRIYHATAPGIDPANPATYTGTHDLMAETWTDELGGNETRFYLLTAIDRSKNESIASAEVTTTSGVLTATTAVDDHADNIDAIFVGKTRIFIKVRSPKPTWSRFSHYNIYFDVDTGIGWSGVWTHLSETRIGFMHRGLSEAHKYKYRVTVESEDGVTTTGTISDNAGAGYQPNALNQNTILADTVAAQNMIAQYDMIAQTLVGGVLQSVNWGGTAGTQFDLDGGTFQIGGSTAPKLSWDGTTLSVVGAITIQSGSGIANLADAGALATRSTIASTHIDNNAVTTPKIAANAITADKINVTTLSAITANMGTLTAGTIRVPNTGWRVEITDGIVPFRYWNGSTTKFQLDSAGHISLNDGTITGGLFRTAVSGLRAMMLAEGPLAHGVAIFDGSTLALMSGVAGGGGILQANWQGNLRINIRAHSDRGEITGFGPNPMNIKNAQLTDSVTGCFKFSNATVFGPAAAPTTWRALNISARVGARRALVLLRVHNQGNDTNYRFRARGDAAEQHSWANEFPGAFSTRVDTIEEFNWVWCITDTTGWIEWNADRAYTTTLILIAYIT